MKRIALSKQGWKNKGKYFALVDDSDYEWLSKWRWYRTTGGYAQRNGNHNHRGHVVVSMHTAIMDTPKGMEVDHINRDKLDNQRSNLRVVGRSENSHNRPKQSNNTSGHRGVFWAGWANMWRVLIKVRGKAIHIGYYKNINDAVVARKRAEVEHKVCV